jgi:hypothetical protein
VNRQSVFLSSGSPHLAQAPCPAAQVAQYMSAAEEVSFLHFPQEPIMVIPALAPSSFRHSAQRTGMSGFFSVSFSMFPPVQH